jgi:hypothetical protein
MPKIYTVTKRWYEFVGTGKAMLADEVYKAILLIGFFLSDVVFESNKTTLILASPPTEKSSTRCNVRIPVVDGTVSIPKGERWGVAEFGIGSWMSEYLRCMEKLGLLKSFQRERWGEIESSPYGIC